MTSSPDGTDELDLTAFAGPGRTVVAIRGDIDVYTAPALREQLLGLIRAGHHNLVLNLDAVQFLDSAGLGVLVGALKRARHHGGSIHLICSRGPILRTLRITGLTGVFPIHPDLPAVTNFELEQAVGQ